MDMRRLACVALLGLVPALAPPNEETDVSEDFARILCTVGPEATPEEVQQRAGDLALLPGAVAAFLAVRAAGMISRGPGVDAMALAPEQVLLLERVGPLLERGRVVACLQHGLESDIVWRRAAIDLLQWCAMASEVSLLVQLAQGGSGTASEERARLDSFRTTLTAVLRRDVGAFDELHLVIFVPEELGIAIVRSVGMAGDPTGMPWLAGLLEQAGLENAALQEIGRMARSVPAARSLEVADAVRASLESEIPSRRKQAMSALAAMGDTQVIPYLIAALEGPESGEQETALGALRELSQRTFPAHADAWRNWYEEEQRWWLEESAAEFERLASDHEAIVLAAIRSISMRGLNRDVLASRIAGLVRDHDSPSVRGHACLGLAQLGSLNPELVAALDDPDARVSRQALTALRSLTKLPLSLDREAWASALRADR